jgi:NADH dehydrogenase FAD-containing subunit
MKKIIVIGGGFAGSFVAKKLERKFNVVLIDSKDYFEFTPGILRTIVDLKHMKKIQILHKDYLKKTKIVVGSVLSIGEKFVIVKNKKILFDYLTICSGSSYNSPFKEKNVVKVTRAKNLKENNNRLVKSDKIIIIGGGLVGVELASEICTFYKDKEIFLIHSQNRLIERMSEKSSEYAEKFLKEHGVKIIYNEKIISQNGKFFLSNKKNKFFADMAFLCTGIISNFSFMEKNFKKELSDSKNIIVNSFLQIPGHENIFVAGDITLMKEEKTAQNAKRQANIVVKNIIALENKKNLKNYSSKKTPLVISLGKYDGILSTENFTITGIIPAILKSLIEKLEMLILRFMT